ncbi:MAG: type IV pilus secretin PilQ [Methylococcaceae bacterium]
MNTKQGSNAMNTMGQWLSTVIGVGLFVISVKANALGLSAVQVEPQAGDKLQIEFEMDGSAAIPKVFHTDSPARIALDFTAVKNVLNKKMIAVNQGSVSSIYLVEAADKMRVVVNLLESTPFETKIVGNKVLLLLNNGHASAPSTVKTALEPTVATKAIEPKVTAVVPVTVATPVITTANSNALAMSAIHVDSLVGDKLQIQLEMNGAVAAPEIFRTDNPARITLDFPSAKNGMNKKIVPVNQGVISSIYLVETADRLRVVINLLEAMPFESKIIGNTVLLILSSNNPTVNVAKTAPAQKTNPAPISTSSRSITQVPVSNTLATSKNYPLTNKLIPPQAISGFDFKRGDNGEGRLLVSLASPNTIVNSKEEGGKIVLSFVNTQLPEQLAKRLDFSEFATPVKYIEATSSTKEATVTITTQNKLYDYSLFQSDGLLTVEFRPLSDQEKETLDKSRVKYTGERLSLNFQDIEIRSVIAILAEFTGQNVVAGDDVLGTITLKLDDVPWDEALDFVMMTKGLGKFETGNVTLISPLDKIKDYKKKQQETETVVSELEPLVSEYIKINYAKATDFRDLLKGSDVKTFGSCSSGQDSANVSSGPDSSSSAGTTVTVSSGDNKTQDTNKLINKNALISLRGSVVVDARTNTLIIRETAKRLEEIKKLIHKLDVPVRQVMIEARIVVASNDFAKQLGVRFGANTAAGNFTQGGRVFDTKPQGQYLGASAAQAVDWEKTAGLSGLTNRMVDLGTTVNPYGALGMTLARGADYVLNLELTALQSQGLGELISNPRVMTSDRCEATIRQGVQIPYQAASATSGIKVSFKDALLSLGVTPQITPNGSIIMDLNISKDAVGQLYGGIPSINTQNVTTNVLVNDGETIVLGGIYEGASNTTVDKVPFFGDLPGVGFLFTRTDKQDNKKELLIFITPKIVKDNTATEGN